jgi:cold shock CspA family protein
MSKLDIRRNGKRQAVDIRTGRVRCFDPEFGGYVIRAEDNATDFISPTSVAQSGLLTLREGDRIVYRLRPCIRNRGRGEVLDIQKLGRW